VFINLSTFCLFVSIFLLSPWFYIFISVHVRFLPISKSCIFFSGGPAFVNNLYNYIIYFILMTAYHIIIFQNLQFYKAMNILCWRSLFFESSLQLHDLLKFNDYITYIIIIFQTYNVTNLLTTPSLQLSRNSGAITVIRNNFLISFGLITHKQLKHSTYIIQDTINMILMKLNLKRRLLLGAKHKIHNTLKSANFIQNVFPEAVYIINRFGVITMYWL
jgi:hypothetical protein